MNAIASKPRISPAVAAFLHDGDQAAREEPPLAAPVQPETPAPEPAPEPLLASPERRSFQTMQVTVYQPEPVVQKMFRMNWRLANALKTAAAQETAKSGRRVTETDIVEELLRRHFKKAGYLD